MRPVTIRMSDRLYAIIAEDARQEGISVASYMREAALSRWAFNLAMDPETRPHAHELLTTAQEALRPSAGTTDNKRVAPLSRDAGRTRAVVAVNAAGIAGWLAFLSTLTDQIPG